MSKDKDGSYNAYVQEHNRLDNLIVESEKIWEDRTYQISAGGLTVSFAVFSLLSDHQVGFDWQMGVITGIYAFCLLINYISHRVAINTFMQLQKVIYDYRMRMDEYSEEIINEIYKTKNKKLKAFNIITQCLLIPNVLYTIVFTFFKLSQL